MNKLFKKQGLKLFILLKLNKPTIVSQGTYVLQHHKNLVVGIIVKHLNCYCLLGAAAPLTNRDCPFLAASHPCIIFFNPLRKAGLPSSRNYDI